MTVSATSTPVTVARKEAVGENLGLSLTQVLYIRYPINFGEKSVLVLLDSGSEINAVYPAFTKELGLLIRPTDIGVHKIDGNTLETYGIVIAAFLVENKANQERLFEETFLVANVSPKVVFGIPFLTMSGADVDFWRRELRWKTYTTMEALPTTRHIKLVGKIEFTAAALDPESEIFVVLVAALSFDVVPSSSPLKLNVHLSWELKYLAWLPRKLL